MFFFQALDDAAKAVKAAFDAAQKKLQDARNAVVEKKAECKRKMSLKCDRCKDLKCRQAERNCKGFLDAAGKWIGGVVNAAGRATCIRNQGDMLGDMALSPTFSFSPPSVSLE